MNKYLITTAIDYTNDVIHIGHAYQKILADCLARYYRLSGKEVFFVTGTDEHGQNVEKSAAKNDRTPKEWSDMVSAEDKEQIDNLDISYNRFIRTTDSDHEKTALWFYKEVLKNGDIYEGEYHGYYCESCEAYKTLSELKNTRCEFHPSLELKRIAEKNYFFRWSKYSDFLKDHLGKHLEFIIPEPRRKEMLAFLEKGLEDIPVTRQNIKWGFSAPNDPNQTIYVWFDALINYYTAAEKVGFWDGETTIIHLLGKDNARWHTLLWPAMLKSAGLRLPDTTLNHGFLNLNGKKISKTLGNIIRPKELTRQYGVDAVRYYLLRHGPLFDDADISLGKLEEVYNADLANGLGNLVSRISKLCQPFDLGRIKPERKNLLAEHLEPFFNHKGPHAFRVDLALDLIWKAVKDIDHYLDREKPWEKEAALRGKILSNIIVGSQVGSILEIAQCLEPFIPKTAQKIKARFEGKVTSLEPLFPRL